MNNDSKDHHRHSIRLQDYDYAQAGAYFVTLCTWQRECLFGEVVDGEVNLNAVGRIVMAEWARLPHHFPNIRLDAYIVMPNHVHGIILISDSVGATRPGRKDTNSTSGFQLNESDSGHIGSPQPSREPGRVLPASHPKGPQPGSIGAMIGQFKSHATRRIWRLPGLDHVQIWQRNYYEHIIRNDHDWEQIIRYIQGNPALWDEDQFHPQVERK